MRIRTIYAFTGLFTGASTGLIVSVLSGAIIGGSVFMIAEGQVSPTMAISRAASTTALITLFLTCAGLILGMRRGILLEHVQPDLFTVAIRGYRRFFLSAFALFCIISVIGALFATSQSAALRAQDMSDAYLNQRSSLAHDRHKISSVAITPNRDGTALLLSIETTGGSEGSYTLGVSVHDPFTVEKQERLVLEADVKKKIITIPIDDLARTFSGESMPSPIAIAVRLTPHTSDGLLHDDLTSEVVTTGTIDAEFEETPTLKGFTPASGS